jgi:hypothetical protein
VTLSSVWIVVLTVLSLAAAPSARLPAGTVVTLLLLDFVDSDHQPVGQPSRARVADAVVVDGVVVIPKGAAALVELAERDGVRSIQLAGVNPTGRLWTRLVDVAGSRSVVAVTATSSAVRRQRGLPEEAVVADGARVYVPSLTTLTLAIAADATLVTAGAAPRD